jgi:hypothetical protein
VDQGVFVYLLTALDAVRRVLDVHFTAQILPDLELGGVGAIEIVERGSLT